MNQGTRSTFAGVAALASVVVLLTLVILGSVAGCGAFKNWQRGQRRADARNRVQLTRIAIQTAQQQARIVHAQDATITAKGQQRIITAKAVARSQAIIHSTLTPLYVQFEAINAQERIATSGRNNTVIYVPAGTNGTPVITQAGKP